MIAATGTAWYAARAGGMLAYLLLSASVAVGLLLSGRARLQRWPRFALEDVHAYLGLLTGAFIIVHGGALLLDHVVPFSLSQLVVPGTAGYRPLDVAFGVVAAELLAALAVTNYYRKRLPHGLWRRLHMLNFAVWGLALAHGLTAGTDATTTWALVVYAGSAWLVLALLVHRISLHWKPVGSTERRTQWQ
ncbi:MAG TPA: ferric reductase-like transmembrane domain-containing protein [Gaiellaceae bacterium]|nr:ferric reductase-like transmembrane domain-containing protein [Gaiellaceae bacterium]